MYVSGLGFYEKSPQQLEKKQLILQYNVILFSMIIYVFLGSMIEREILYLMSLFGMKFGINANGDFAGNFNNLFEISIIIKCIFSTLTPLIIIAMFNHKTLSIKNTFRLPKVKNILFATFILMGAMVLGILVTDFFEISVNHLGIYMPNENRGSGDSFTSFFLLAVYAMLVKPFFDELLFRGVILNSLRKYGDIIAIILSTVLFALSAQRFDMFIFNFITGLGFSYFAIKSNSFITTFIARSVMNMYLFFASINGVNFEMFEYVDVLFISISFVSLVVFIIYIMSDKNAFVLENKRTCLSNTMKLNLVLTNFCFWSLIMICIVRSLSAVEFVGRVL